MKKICVFCGSNSGDDQQYQEQVQRLAQYLKTSAASLVYGGGRLGMMGEIFVAVRAQGCPIIGVVPEILRKEAVTAAPGVTLEYVSDMSARKKRMLELADAFVILPGGLGTMEEFFQVYSWNQLGINRKPIVVANIDGYYDQLLAFLQDVVDHGFMPQANLDSLIVTQDVAKGLKEAENYRYQKVNKWK